MNLFNMNQLVSTDCVVYEVINSIEETETLLRCCWMRFFGTPGEDDQPKDNLQEIGVLLSVCCDRLYDVLLRYKLAVGNDGPDVDNYFSEAKDFQEIHELSRLYNAVHERERKLSGSERSALEAKRKAIAALPPAAAIPALRALLKGGEADAE